MSQVKQQHEIIGNKSTGAHFEQTQHPDAKWFLSGGNLGLFIHYGICTVHGNIDLSWGMMDEKPYEMNEGKNRRITPNQYFALAKEFNPAHFDPENWMKAIKEAGFTYAVFTTRHHDGFALWPSDFGDFNTKNDMNGRDLVGEYVEACRKYDIKVGLYYSPPDWHYFKNYMSFHCGSGNPKYADRAHYGPDFEVIAEVKKPSDEMMDKYYDYINGQIRELMTRYGKIDVLWFDGSVPDVSRAITIEQIRAYQPGIVINHRLHGEGDFDTFECRMPDTKPEGTWEHCHIWFDDGGWAYMESAKGFRPAQWVYDTYQQCKAWGGNYLIDAGPTKDGTMPDYFYTGVKELSSLLKKSLD